MCCVRQVVCRSGATNRAHFIMQAACHVDQLPDEMLEAILSHVSNCDRRQTLRLVCLRFRHLVRLPRVVLRLLRLVDSRAFLHQRLRQMRLVQQPGGKLGVSLCRQPEKTGRLSRAEQFQDAEKHWCLPVPPLTYHVERVPAELREDPSDRLAKLRALLGCTQRLVLTTRSASGMSPPMRANFATDLKQVIQDYNVPELEIRNSMSFFTELITCPTASDWCRTLKCVVLDMRNACDEWPADYHKCLPHNAHDDDGDLLCMSVSAARHLTRFEFYATYPCAPDFCWCHSQHISRGVVNTEWTQLTTLRLVLPFCSHALAVLQHLRERRIDTDRASVHLPLLSRLQVDYSAVDDPSDVFLKLTDAYAFGHLEDAADHAVTFLWYHVLKTRTEAGCPLRAIYWHRNTPTHLWVGALMEAKLAEALADPRLGCTDLELASLSLTEFYVPRFPTHLKRVRLLSEVHWFDMLNLLNNSKHIQHLTVAAILDGNEAQFVTGLSGNILCSTLVFCDLFGWTTGMLRCVAVKVCESCTVEQWKLEKVEDICHFIAVVSTFLSVSMHQESRLRRVVVGVVDYDQHLEVIDHMIMAMRRRCPTVECVVRPCDTRKLNRRYIIST